MKLFSSSSRRWKNSRELSSMLFTRSLILASKSLSASSMPQTAARAENPGEVIEHHVGIAQKRGKYMKIPVKTI